MGAFCVFGISRSFCKAEAEKKVVAYNMTIEEWAIARDRFAAKLFEESEKPVRISPEFDSPQFCHDWMAVAPSEIKLAKVMVRGPKYDGGGQADNAQRRAGNDLARIHRNQPVPGACE